MERGEKNIVAFYRLPPSAKFIYYVLKRNGGEAPEILLLEETKLPRRTLSYGLKVLESREFVERFNKKHKRGRGNRVDRRFVFWRLLNGTE